MPTQTIGVIGDFNPQNKTHLATNESIAHAAQALALDVQTHWIGTQQIAEEGTAILKPFQALWCSPGSPYHNMEGALTAIRYAREENIPFFGT